MCTEKPYGLVVFYTSTYAAACENIENIMKVYTGYTSNIPDINLQLKVIASLVNKASYCVKDSLYISI